MSVEVFVVATIIVAALIALMTHHSHPMPKCAVEGCDWPGTKDIWFKVSGKTLVDVHVCERDSVDLIRKGDRSVVRFS